MNLTPEQQAILAAARLKPSIMVRALAGCAKTTTIVEMAKAMKPTTALAIAFGVKTKDELKERLPDWIEVKTLNSIGHSAWGSALGKRIEIDKDKLINLLRPYKLEEESWYVVRGLVVAARHAGIVPSGSPGNSLLPDTAASWESLTDETPSLQHISTAREVLQKCVNLSYSGVLDYDDQAYMSALFGGAFKRYKLVIVDEAQDLSPLNHKMLARLAEDRIIAVGDENQSIYGFRGADINSMDNLRKLRPEWLDFTLSVTFRCPKVVVKRRNAFLPSFTAAPAAIEGEIIDRRGNWYWENVPKDGTIAILCRNNAPLVSMSFNLMKIGVPFHFLGKDSSRSIKSLAKKILPVSGTREEFLLRIADWKFLESGALMEAGKHSKIDVICDRADALSAVVANCPVAQNGTTSFEAVKYAIDAVFNRSGFDIVTLSTAHKFKGLEADTVIHLDPFRVPSKFATSETAYRQELNILNVIETRTKKTLFLANVEHFQGE